MLHLADLCASFSSYPSLTKTVTLDDINQFLRLAHHFLDEIKLHVPPNSTAPPYRLPIYVHQLIRSCLDLDDNIVICLWDALKDAIWEDPEQDAREGLSKDQIDKIDLHAGKSVRPEERLGAQIPISTVSVSPELMALRQHTTCSIRPSQPAYPVGHV
jgi:hypothetical protein